ncbi:hypothetical protein PAPYR_940 [Paratrimastix pyriformis]|uniref:Uncharacterized protein n=1 Tax=Paratrimastix pyriformis TaxID=342808 RepID=A0ABQ8UT61_9EUKA|nr:hypothetical protein PAPYR_940 [Paratrimastix pyriformis]
MAGALTFTAFVVQDDCPLVRYVSLQEPPTPRLFKCYVTPREQGYSIKVRTSTLCCIYVYVDGKKLTSGGYMCYPEEDTIAATFDVDDFTKRPLLFTRPPVGAPTAPGGVVRSDDFGTIRIEFYAVESDPDGPMRMQYGSRTRRRMFDQATSADATAVTSATGRIAKYATKLGAEVYSETPLQYAPYQVAGGTLAVATFCLVTDKQLQVMGCEPDSAPNDDGIVFFNPAPVAPAATSTLPAAPAPTGPGTPAAEGPRRRRRKQPAATHTDSATQGSATQPGPTAVVTLDEPAPAAHTKRSRPASMDELVVELGRHSSAGEALPADQAERRVRALRGALGGEAMGLRGAAATERLNDLTPDQLRQAEPALSQAEATALLQDVVASTA